MMEADEDGRLEVDPYSEVRRLAEAWHDFDYEFTLDLLIACIRQLGVGICERQNHTGWEKTVEEINACLNAYVDWKRAKLAPPGGPNLKTFLWNEFIASLKPMRGWWD